MSWTELEAKDYILSQLGYPMRKVELDVTNLDQALIKSVKTYSTIKPVIRKGSLTVLNMVQSYKFVDLGLPYGKGLITVYQEPITSPAAVFTEYEFYRLRQPPYVDMGELILDKLYYSEIGRITGTDFDWHWDQQNRMLLVSPVPSRSFRLAYDYSYEPTVITEVPEVNQNWIVDYALAIAKEMLGRVRSKYQGVPGNDLPVNTDGEALLSEGKEGQTSLAEYLKGTRGDWTAPIKG